MQGTNFVALTGHLNDYPLADLIGILRRQRKSGRLLIEYSISPCSIYFADGNLVDAQLNTMSGLQALVVALSQPNASFNFNPLIEPPTRSINEASQKVILELLGCWEEKTIDVEATAQQRPVFAADHAQEVDAGAAQSFVDAGPGFIDADELVLPKAKEVLALPPSSLERTARRRHRQLLLASAIISLVVSLVTVVALARWLIRRDISAAVSEMVKKNGMAGSRDQTTPSKAEMVKVMVRVEKGRVTQAAIAERRPGMESYEALALKIARQRRYAASQSGQETVLVKIYAPE